MKALAVSALVTGCVAGNPTPDAAVAVPDAPSGTATIAPAMADWGTISRFNAPPWPTKQFVVTALGQTSPLQAALVGPDAGDFSLMIDGCSGKELAATSQCTIEVKLDPAGTIYGPRAARLQVSGGTAFTATSTLAADYQSFGDLSIAGSPWDFGTQITGTTSATRTFTITSSSSLASGTATVTKGGSDQAEFTIVTDGCGGHPLAGFASCAIEVAFAPTSAGPKTASITFSANPGGMVVAAVAGTGATN